MSSDNPRLMSIALNWLKVKKEPLCTGQTQQRYSLTFNTEVGEFNYAELLGEEARNLLAGCLDSRFINDAVIDIEDQAQEICDLREQKDPRVMWCFGDPDLWNRPLIFRLEEGTDAASD